MIRGEMIESVKEALCGGGEEPLVVHQNHLAIAAAAVTAVRPIPDAEFVSLSSAAQKASGGTTVYECRGWFKAGNGGTGLESRVMLEHEDGGNYDLTSSTARNIAHRLLAAANQADSGAVAPMCNVSVRCSSSVRAPAARSRRPYGPRAAVQPGNHDVSRYLCEGS